MTSQGRATLRFHLPLSGPATSTTTCASRENIAYASIERDSVAYLYDDNLSDAHPPLYLKSCLYLPDPCGRFFLFFRRITRLQKPTVVLISCSYAYVFSKFYLSGVKRKKRDVTDKINACNGATRRIVVSIWLVVSDTMQAERGYPFVDPSRLSGDANEKKMRSSMFTYPSERMLSWGHLKMTITILLY